MKKDTLERAMMHLDDGLIAQAARPAAKKPGVRWKRVALMAACVAAVMAVTVGAGTYAIRYRFTRLDERRLAVEVEKPDANESEKPAETPKEPTDYTKFDCVYLPTEFPGEAVMRAAGRIGSEYWLTGYEWEWKIDGKYQLNFSQDRLGYVEYGNRVAAMSTITFETGEIDMGGIPVSYISTCNHGTPISHTLMWSDETYMYTLRYGVGVPLEELEKVILSLQPVEPQVYNALLEEHAKEEDTADRVVMQQVLLPDAVPRGLTVGGYLEADSCVWHLVNAEGYDLLFYQEDLGCQVSKNAPGHAKRRWDMQNNEYLVDVVVAGKQMRLLGGGEEEYLWEYFWEQDGNWCSLSVDKAIADQLGLTMEELAEQLVSGLILTPMADARAALDALK